MSTSAWRLSKKLVAGVASGSLAISGLALALGSTPAHAALATTTSRVGGVNRYDTARLAALATFPSGSANAVLASGENFPDGLAAADLAGAIGAPLLLTPAASLAPETVSALATLHVHTVYVVGGAAAVAAGVIASLQGLGYTVPTAISGADRYATAAAVATTAATSAAVGTLAGLKTAILATGANYPDALASGAIAYKNHLPILLTDPSTLSTAASTALTSLGIQQVLIAGGTSAVSAAVETAVKALKVGGTGALLTTVRIAGATRNDTAAQMATKEITPVISGGFGFGLGNVILASGVNFPDALDAAEFGAPILLDGAAGLPTETTAFLTTNGASIGNIQAQGGTTVIPAADLTAAYTATAPTSGTATIAGVAGGTSFTVTFSQPIITTGIAATAFLINNANGAGSKLNLATVSATPTSVLVSLAAGTTLAAGDVITLNAGAITGSNGNPVPGASFTVPASAAPALVSDQFYVGGSAIELVFSKPIATGTLVAANVLLSATGGVTLGGIAAHSADNTAFELTTSGPIPTNATLQLTTAITDLSAVALSNPQLITAQPNTVAPFVSTNIVSPFSVTQGNVSFAADSTAGEKLTISAKPGSAADGAYGSLFSVQILTAAASGVSATSTTNTTTGATLFQITVPTTAGVYPTPIALAAALNASAPFNTVLVANAVGTHDTSTITAAAAAALGTGGGTVGTTVENVSLVLSKSVVPTAALTNTANYGISGGGTIALVSVDNAAAPSVVTLTVSSTTAAMAIVAGTTTVTVNIAAAIHDYAGNAMTLPVTVVAT